MYSNEAKGERFPPIQLGGYTNLAGQPQGAGDAGPNLFVLYPEYLTDPMIVFCPSDAELGDSIEKAKNPATGEWCFNVSDSHGGKCARAVDASYGYLGWVLDLGECTDPTWTPSQFTIIPIAAGMLGADLPADAQISVQVGKCFDTILEGVLQILSAPPAGILPLADQDIDVGAPYGNGGGETVYRLREGIERFLITDINNPAASAKAQSEVWIMFDQLSTNPSAYNHIPGGSNVLFMDGHVAFQRYGLCEPAPTNEPMARMVGILTQ